ncbi:hypothetical protein, partial [Fulvivirga lutimaris]|uniref:hypothetical protein n=1 Tax=Fulvivirga lutimaris TaxID=1819566 RepID=UPI0012BD7BF6
METTNDISIADAFDKAKEFSDAKFHYDSIGVEYPKVIKNESFQSFDFFNFEPNGTLKDSSDYFTLWYDSLGLVGK